MNVVLRLYSREHTAFYRVFQLEEIYTLIHALLSSRWTAMDGNGWERLGVQTVVSCERWTPDTKMFATRVLKTPLLIFTSFVECAVKFRVPHPMTWVKSSEKINCLEALIERYPTEKIAVGCINSEDVKEARGAVNSLYPTRVVVAHEDMSKTLLDRKYSTFNVEHVLETLN